MIYIIISHLLLRFGKKINPSRCLIFLSGSSVLWDVPGVHSYGIKHFECTRFTECILHTLDLGVAPRYVAFTMLLALRKDVYDVQAKSMHVCC